MKLSTPCWVLFLAALSAVFCWILSNPFSTTISPGFFPTLSAAPFYHLCRIFLAHFPDRHKGVSDHARLFVFDPSFTYITGYNSTRSHFHWLEMSGHYKKPGSECWLFDSLRNRGATERCGLCSLWRALRCGQRQTMMVIQRDLVLNTNHIRRVSVDENDKTSALHILKMEVSGKQRIKFITTCLFLSSISGCQTPTTSAKLVPNIIWD